MIAKNLRTIKQLAEQCPGFTEASLRKLVFDAPNNNLESAIVRVGRRLFIDLAAFDKWLEERRAA